MNFLAFLLFIPTATSLEYRKTKFIQFRDSLPLIVSKNDTLGGCRSEIICTRHCLERSWCQAVRYHGDTARCYMSNGNIGTGNGEPWVRSDFMALQRKWHGSYQGNGEATEQPVWTTAVFEIGGALSGNWSVPIGSNGYTGFCDADGQFQITQSTTLYTLDILGYLHPSGNFINGSWYMVDVGMSKRGTFNMSISPPIV